MYENQSRKFYQTATDKPKAWACEPQEFDFIREQEYLGYKQASATSTFSIPSMAMQICMGSAIGASTHSCSSRFH